MPHPTGVPAEAIQHPFNALRPGMAYLYTHPDGLWFQRGDQPVHHVPTWLLNEKIAELIAEDADQSAQVTVGRDYTLYVYTNTSYTYPELRLEDEEENTLFDYAGAWLSRHMPSINWMRVREVVAFIDSVED